MLNAFEAWEMCTSHSSELCPARQDRTLLPGAGTGSAARSSPSHHTSMRGASTRLERRYTPARASSPPALPPDQALLASKPLATFRHSPTAGHAVRPLEGFGLYTANCMWTGSVKDLCRNDVRSTALLYIRPQVAALHPSYVIEYNTSESS